MCVACPGQVGVACSIPPAGYPPPLAIPPFVTPVPPQRGGSHEVTVPPLGKGVIAPEICTTLQPQPCILFTSPNHLVTIIFGWGTWLTILVHERLEDPFHTALGSRFGYRCLWCSRGGCLRRSTIVKSRRSRRLRRYILCCLQRRSLGCRMIQFRGRGTNDNC